MDKREHRLFRRKLLQSLYDHYVEEPLGMMTPADILPHEEKRSEFLVGSIFYLHELGLVEIMTGYGPTGFDAARITPAGIDLVESGRALEERFPGTNGQTPHLRQLQAAFLRAALEAEESGMDGVPKAWLLRDLHTLRERLILTPNGDHAQVAQTLLMCIRGYFRETNTPMGEAFETLFALLADEGYAIQHEG